MTIERIDRDWLATHGGGQMAMHLNMGDGDVLIRHVVDRHNGTRVGLQRKNVTLKGKRSRVRGGTFWIVDGVADEFDQLQPALELLDLARRGDELAARDTLEAGR
jgi:hypothetical protein